MALAPHRLPLSGIPCPWGNLALAQLLLTADVSVEELSVEVRCWSLGAVKCENLFCSRSLLTWTWWDVLPWCGHSALELWQEPRLPLHARLGGAVGEFLSASTSVLNKSISNAPESLTQWAGVVSFLRTITPGSSVMVLPLRVLSKPSRRGCAMACAMSPALHLSPQNWHSLCLIRDHPLCLQPPKSLCGIHVLPVSALALFPCPRSASAFLPMPPALPLPSLAAPVALQRARVLCLKVSAFDPKQ